MLPAFARHNLHGSRPLFQVTAFLVAADTETWMLAALAVVTHQRYLTTQPCKRKFRPLPNVARSDDDDDDDDDEDDSNNYNEDTNSRIPYSYPAGHAPHAFAQLVLPLQCPQLLPDPEETDRE